MDVGFKVQAFNYKVRHRRLEMGLTQYQLGELSQVGKTTVYHAETLTHPRVVSRRAVQDFIDRLRQLAAYLELDFAEVFPDEYLEALSEGRLWRRNTIYLHREVSFAELEKLESQALITSGGLDKEPDTGDIVRQCIDGLPSEVQKDVIRMHYGIDCEPMTLREIAGVKGVSLSHVRQVEGNALKHLRHPIQSRKMRDLL